MNESRNLLLAVGLSLLVLIGFNFFYDAPKKQSNVSNTTTIVNAVAQNNIEPKPRKDALEVSRRIKINSDTISGSLQLTGALIDDISLKNYHETADLNSPTIALLNPSNTKSPLYLFSGWKSSNNIGKLPDENTVWKVEGEAQELTPTQPLTMVWFNENGIKFERIIQLDDQYLFTITDKVANFSQQEINVQPFTQLHRSNPPKSSGFFILHEGPIGVFDKRLFETSYEDLQKQMVERTTTGGWLGFTDKYWLVSLIPDQKLPIKTSYSSTPQENYLIQSTATSYSVQPGAIISYTYHLFAGPKVLRILDSYEEKYGFQRFDLAVDFGWFYFLTKPLFYVLEFLHQILGNLGLAILVLTVLFKIVLYPFANKSYRSMARMKNLQPKLEQIKQRYENDKMRMNQAIMEFYKKEKVNPLGGCLPMLIQAPIFFCLYKVFFVTIEMRHAPFFWWIHDLAAPDPTTAFNLFGLINWIPPSFLQIGVWPLIMGLTMLLQQRLNPQPADPIQARVMLIMPIMFTYMFSSFPVGLVIYWAWNNILSMLQQWIINKQQEKIA